MLVKYRIRTLPRSHQPEEVEAHGKVENDQRSLQCERTMDNHKVLNETRHLLLNASAWIKERS